MSSVTGRSPRSLLRRVVALGLTVLVGMAPAAPPPGGDREQPGNPVLALPGEPAGAPTVSRAAAAGVQAPPPPASGKQLALPPLHAPHEQLTELGAAQAWQLTTGAGVVVAVLDSGVDAEHPDLAGRVLPGIDYVDGSTDGREDPVGHGTTVASMVAGAGEPAVGMAPDARILPVRVLDEDNRYQRASTIAEGVIWAVDQGADVINLSLGGPRDSAALADALAYAMARDVVVVACTGNLSGDDYQEIWYPAREPGVIAVAGLTIEQGRAEAWPTSLTGPETVLAAPAVVTGAEAGGGHRQVQGTSFAAGLVAGVAALLRAHQPELTAAEVVHRLVTTAEDLGHPGRNYEYGYGAVNPVAALTAPVLPVTVNPLDTKARHATAGLGPAPTRPEHLAAAGGSAMPGTAPATPADAGSDSAAEDRAAGAIGPRPASPTRLSWAVLAVVAASAALLGIAAGLATRHRHSWRPPTRR